MMDVKFNRKYNISDPSNRQQVGNRNPPDAAIRVQYFLKML